MIETTINMREDIFKKLEDMSGKLNISKNGIIKMVMSCYMDRYDENCPATIKTVPQRQPKFKL